MGSMTRALLLVVLLAAVAIPSTASAAAGPCRNKIYNDWYPDGKIASTYPVACYRDALKHIRSDAAIYSSMSDDIRAAMRAAIQRANGKTAPAEVGHAAKAIGTSSVLGTTASIAASDPQHSASDARSGSSSSSAAPQPVADSSSGTPLPILLLGAVALVLIAAGAVGAGVRHFRSGR
jgi:Arc/MetJ-type ribon-helix-helix transcriptional regulator